MTKELSKQICEICGIKDNVDFGKAENFVKLLKIVSKKVDVIFSFRNGNFECAIYGGLFTDDESFENNFLNALVRIIKDNPLSYCCNHITQANIKLAIREAEWKYE